MAPGLQLGVGEPVFCSTGTHQDSPMLEVIEINDRETFSSFFMPWSSMWRETRGASFFHSFDWLDQYWRHLAPKNNIRLLIACRNGSPIGALPLQLSQRRTPLGATRVLGFPTDPWQSFYGPVGSDPAATLKMCLDYLKKNREGWDQLDFRWIDRDGDDRGRMETSLRLQGWRFQRDNQHHFPHLELKTNSRNYFDTRSPRLCEKLWEAEQSLSQQGEVTFQRHRPWAASEGDGEPRMDLLAACTGLADGDTRTDRMLRDCHLAAARSGCVDINLLQLDGSTIGYSYNFTLHGRVTVVAQGFDTEMQEASHLVLTARMIRDSFARGDVDITWHDGDASRLTPWSSHIRSGYRYRYYGRRLASQACRLFDRGLRQTAAL